MTRLADTIETKSHPKRSSAVSNIWNPTKNNMKIPLPHKKHFSLSKYLHSTSNLERIFSDLHLRRREKGNGKLNGILCKRKASTCLVRLAKGYETSVCTKTTSSASTTNRHNFRVTVLPQKCIKLPCSENDMKFAHSWGLFVNSIDESEPIEF
jgi:hypothetical protein